ncbi:hypothetical protein ACH5RR_005352 [Cinchona calisaya]|uniref:SAWADEE domain-containing protein n=1 Tax=Cinchona calisaya TaxID=153742 RepID=A0ABD3AL67_9GENT
MAAVNTTPNDTELEAMRKDDFSWHPCKVSLCSSGIGLIVEYLNNDLDFMIVTKEEALARLRIRSAPLQSDECSLIQEGECVLATNKSQPKGLFFEAEVEKTLRVRHSKKIHCRCTFVVRWIHHGREGETAILPSSAIMKMSTKCINIHPTIVAFFNSLTTKIHQKFSPLPSFVEGMDWEMDDFELEKQIKEISFAADSSGMKISQNILSGIEVHIQKQYQCKATPKSRKKDSGIQLIDTEVKGFSHPSPFIQDEFAASSTPLNPIAARAALAYLMSKFSQSTECSPTLKEAKGFRPQPGISETEATTVTFAPKYENIVKTLFPAEEASKEPNLFDAPCELSKWDSKNEECQPEFVDCVANIDRSTTKKNSGMHARIGLSCSARQRSSERSCDNVEMTCIAETKLMHSMNTRRLTRSAVRKADAKVISEAKNVNTGKYSSVLEKDLLEDEKTVVSPIDASLTNKLKDQVAKRETLNKNESLTKTSSAGIETLNNSRRLTRSAVCGKTQNNDVGPYKRCEESRLSEYVKSDIIKGNTTPECNASETENPISATLPNAISSTHTAERYKKVQKVAPVKTTQKIAGDAASNDVPRQGVKRKSNTFKEQVPRFSPRLRFLPRTRSQKQS